MAIKDRRIKGFRSWIIMIFFVISVLLTINQIFDIQFLIGKVLLEPTFNFLVAGFLIPLVFLGRSSGSGKKFTLVDTLSFFIYFGISLYLSWSGYDILTRGYGYMAPFHFVILTLIIWALALETIRRSGGFVYMLVVLFFSIYPLFASHMPGFLEGVERTLDKTALFHILSTESAMGTLMEIFANIVYGYVFFGIVVIATGGDDFLVGLAYNVVGKARGGPAKMAVIASAMFGSISGSSVANVLTTGSITIPAMKSCGYRPEYAGAVETCSSTAGTITPPVMGATAFVMASLLDMPYSHVALAAAIPAFLFYVPLYVQVDGQAAKYNLRGLSREQAPPVLELLKDGWFYFPGVIILVYFLFVLRWEGEAPFISAFLMLVLAQIRKKTRFTLKSFLRFLEDGGIGSATLLAIMLGAGMLMGSFSLTGIATTFSRELFILAGGNNFLILLYTAIASLILGMGMTLIACYIFLALIVAPALIQSGMNELAVHMFVLYCGMLSFITPPVALCAFAAATIAEASPMKIGLTAVRLGGAIFLLPFFFVYDPVLVAQGTATEIIYALVTATLGMAIMGSGLEGYMMWVGNFCTRKIGVVYRVLFVVAGVLLACPGWLTDLIGIILFGATLGMILLIRPPWLTLGKL